MTAPAEDYAAAETPKRETAPYPRTPFPFVDQKS